MNFIRSHVGCTASVVALALGLTLGMDASAASSTNATLNWSSFTATSADPGFAFIVDPSYGTTVTALTQAFAPSFTTPIAAGDPGTGLAATANGTTLSATVASATGQGYAARSADVTRAADFTLDAGASVTFTVAALVSTNDAADPATTSFASLSVLGGDLGYQISSVNVSADGTNHSQSGVLTLTVTNSSNAVATDYLSVEGTVNVNSIQAVPEPATALLLLPGLLAGGVFVSRRRSAHR